MRATPHMTCDTHSGRPGHGPLFPTAPVADGVVSVLGGTPGERGNSVACTSGLADGLLVGREAM